MRAQAVTVGRPAHSIVAVCVDRSLSSRSALCCSATSPSIVRSVLEAASLTSQDHFVDIGAGDGRLCIAAARDFHCASVTGLEIDSEVAKLCRANIAREGLSERISIVEGDARKADISSATCIALYLSERGNAALRPLLQPILLARPATRVVSFVFPMPSWTPVRTELEKDSGIPIHVFDGSSLPANIRSAYESRRGEREAAEKEAAASASAAKAQEQASQQQQQKAQ